MNDSTQVATDCQYYVSGLCAVASHHSGKDVEARADACAACQNCINPRQLNNVTASLAIQSIGFPVPADKKYLLAEVTAKSEGPGTELQNLISWFWWPSGKCERCRNRALKMNKWGPGKCRRRKPLIVAWLRQSASKAGLPFSETMAGVAIDIAIARAEKKQARLPAVKPPEPPAREKRYSAVWVYWRGGAASDELEYSIRSAITNLSDLANVVVCGDHPGEWYDGDFIHSPRFNKQDGIAKFGSGRFSKWIDSAIKLQRIIESDLVTESFLWMYDDTFFVKPWSIEQTAILRAGGSLWDLQKIDTPSKRTWREVMRRTARALADRGLPQHNYSTHYPVVYQKKLLAQTIREFDLLQCARLVESLYLNHHFRNPQPASEVFQYSKKIPIGWKMRDNVAVVNVGGFHKGAQDVIRPMFPQHLKIPAIASNQRAPIHV